MGLLHYIGGKAFLISFHRYGQQGTYVRRSTGKDGIPQLSSTSSRADTSLCLSPVIDSIRIPSLLDFVRIPPGNEVSGWTGRTPSAGSSATSFRCWWFEKVLKVNNIFRDRDEKKRFYFRHGLLFLSLGC
ncbi:hypothetical protein TNCV_3179861 [Trichonephila clavipes]|nr:hypothetical protein TNCV_3179861 [Trichonephila clavipes]